MSSTRDLHHLRKIAVLRWLAKFYFSPVNQLIRLAGAPNHQFLYKIRDAGLIQSTRTAVKGKSIWRLTASGRELARAYISDNQDVYRPIPPNLHRSKNRLNDSFFLQDYLLKDYKPDSKDSLDHIHYVINASSKSRHSLDCILTTADDCRIALQVVLRKPSEEFYSRIFQEHLRSIQKLRSYDAVRFVFSDSKIEKQLLSLLNNWSLRDESFPLRKYLTHEIYIPDSNRVHSS